MDKFIYIDFEYNNSQEEKINLVSCSFIGTDGSKYERWLKDDLDVQEDLADILERYNAAGYCFVAYASNAEARAFQALHLDPSNFKWVDLYSEWLQITYNNNSRAYGTIFKNGYAQTSVAPNYNPKYNIGKNNAKVGKGLAAAVGQVLGINIDTKNKNAMRDLILENKEHYTAEEVKAITTYCTSDIIYLNQLHSILTKELSSLIKLPIPRLENAQLKRGAFMASIAKMESNGYPVNVAALKALRDNYKAAEDSIIKDLVDNYYPFFTNEGTFFTSKWVGKYSSMAAFIEGKGLADKWDLTDKGKYSTEDKTLEKFNHIPEVEAYRRARKKLSNLRWLKKPDTLKAKRDGDFFNSIGKDGRLRTFLGAYGTQTSRNAPKASRFILAMSSWLRCTIVPPVGNVIIGADFGSQEFYVAGWLSGDKAMIEAYSTGDPYLYLAKVAGAVPKLADNKKVKNPASILAEYIEENKLGIDAYHLTDQDRELLIKDPIWATYEQYLGYNDSRTVFKALTLGLQFGLGVANLAIKLTADLKREVTEAEAGKLVKLHKRTYSTFWKWVDKQANEHSRKGCLTLYDGWSLLKDIDNVLSIKNFPVQGTAAVCMREAVRLAEERGLKILSPLHDALYIEAPAFKAEEQAKILAEAMQEATRTVLGIVEGEDIRIDVDIHSSSDTWVEPKGARDYEQLKQYLTVEDKVDVVKWLRY